ncbi:MAG TPA: nitroreductase/quinone reductase family protein [Acidimicrobiia bacterium]|nr:nitroreductase/quinone reductase family protein [Acidimicrobiia bacterium]
MSLDIDALASHQTIHMTTCGRRTGRPRRIEIWWFRVDGRFVVTGTPGKRDWLANLMEDPRLKIHVDGVDIDATATIVEDRELRRRVFTAPQASWYVSQAELDRLVDTAPMVEIHFLD